MIDEKERAMIFHADFNGDQGFNVIFKEDKAFNATFGNIEKINTSDYDELFNKPSIEGITLQGNKTFKQLGMDALTIQEIEKILYL